MWHPGKLDTDFLYYADDILMLSLSINRSINNSCFIIYYAWTLSLKVKNKTVCIEEEQFLIQPIITEKNTHSDRESGT